MLAFSDQDQGKKRIIDDIDVIRINAFADQGSPVVRDDLPDPEDLHEYQVYKAFLAHFPPGLTIIMVLINHGGPCDRQLFIV